MGGKYLYNQRKYNKWFSRFRKDLNNDRKRSTTGRNIHKLSIHQQMGTWQYLKTKFVLFMMEIELFLCRKA
jgi:hypothetical protein